MKKKYTGFTLIEVLIVLLIFSIISILAISVFRQTLIIQEMNDFAQKRIYEIRIARALMKSDFLQISSRKVRDYYGITLPFVFYGTSENVGKPFMQFVRDGWENPNGISSRSSLQRVEYFYDDNLIKRRLYKYLDGDNEKNAQTDVLMSNVVGFKIQFFVSGQWRDESFVKTIQDSNFPEVISIEMELEDIGKIQQLFFTSYAKL